MGKSYRKLAPKTSVKVVLHDGLSIFVSYKNRNKLIHFKEKIEWGLLFIYVALSTGNVTRQPETFSIEAKVIWGRRS